ncbi:hypothetical protein DFQ26_001960 [Actinomortierella ambigua]|nr:hypothetical protein DFQ26_001960 [Actinomortierella ambigua]
MLYSPTLLFTVALTASLSLSKGSIAAARNLTQQDFRRWTENIEKARANVGVQGLSVAVVYKGETIYAQGFGKRNAKDTFTVETASCIASVGKALTAAAVGEIVATGKADWVTPVNEYVPEFKSKNPFLTAEINFIDLLSHRTGYPSLNYHWYHRAESRSELIKKMRYVDPVAPLRSKFIYNNAMYALAGEASARLDGKSWEEVVRDRILIPAGMTSSGFTIKTLLTRPNHAVPFRSKSFEAAQRGEVELGYLETRSALDAPAGVIFSNVIDMAKWAKVMLRQGTLNGKQVLHKETVEAVTKSHIPSDNGTYGLGWLNDSFKRHRMVHHSGSYTGYVSDLTLFPDDDLAVIALSNTEASYITGILRYYLADYILDLPKTKDWLSENLVELDRSLYKASTNEALESFFPPQIKNKPPTRKLEDFAGDWTHPYGTPFSVFHSRKGKLDFKAMGNEGALDHYHYDSFRARMFFLGIPVPAILTFITGRDGSVDQLQVTFDGESLLYTRSTRS